MTTRERIEEVLNRIRWVYERDGIAFELIEVRDGHASIRVTGMPVQCVTAPLNLHTGLEQLLREEIKGFGDLQIV